MPILQRSENSLLAFDHPWCWVPFLYSSRDLSNWDSPYFRVLLDALHEAV